MLQSLELSDNPITSEPDYRSQILGRVPNRINDLVVSSHIYLTEIKLDLRLLATYNLVSCS